MSEPAPTGRSPRPSRGPFAYVLLLALVWWALALYVGTRGAVRLEELPGLLVLALMALISALTRDTPTGAAANSFTTAILLACLVLYGPIAAGVLGVVTAFADRTYGFSIVSAFNGLMMGLMSLAGGITYLTVGGVHDLGPGMAPDLLGWQVALPLFMADLVMCLLNVLVLGGMVVITGGSWRSMLLGSVRGLVPLYLGYGVIAFVFVLLWGAAGVGPLSAVLMAAPLAIVRFVYVQYGDEVRAHARVLTLLTASADSHDGRLAVHARRVDRVCQLIAAHLALGENERQVLTYAAKLHDLGMKGVLCATDTRRGGSGPYTNVRALIPHPVTASEIVREVDFLADAAPIIRAHHERMDGRGYPDGLRGEEIPLLARILAVADAFDALTTTKGVREAIGAADAIAELRLSAGAHLDPEIVEILAQVMRGRSWSLYVDPADEGAWLWDQHTLPAMSDVIADELVDRAPGPVDVNEVSLSSTTDGSPPAPWRSGTALGASRPSPETPDPEVAGADRVDLPGAMSRRRGIGRSANAQKPGALSRTDGPFSVVPGYGKGHR
ncbi:HD domain-containing protein [Austwickia chelonae]|uniref:HD-GYP domain-containing protein n=1 Tax=Austwickia chelonae NBRC 105200 TaxID=1184607 RepID=K6VSK6_9MICO|nr:HD domain-containing phosphohydrolase [Austwickia chelonae]GAB78325.1 hypothetical protein AUCHE_08_05720 [Austwickia chelonae NBRC 105200]SEW01322.1 HD domain-containing protein [Austwickia chelonae]